MHLLFITVYIFFFWGGGVSEHLYLPLAHSFFITADAWVEEAGRLLSVLLVGLRWQYLKGVMGSWGWDV